MAQGNGRVPSEDFTINLSMPVPFTVSVQKHCLTISLFLFYKQPSVQWRRGSVLVDMTTSPTLQPGNCLHFPKITQPALFLFLLPEASSWKHGPSAGRASDLLIDFSINDKALPPSFLNTHIHTRGRSQSVCIHCQVSPVALKIKRLQAEPESWRLDNTQMPQRRQSCANGGGGFSSWLLQGGISLQTHTNTNFCHIS